MLRFLPAFAALTLVPIAVGCSGGNSSGGSEIKLNGKGATFVQPIMNFWTSEYRDKTNGGVHINYQGTGSGGGISSMTDKLCDFGCSDAPMNSKQLAAAKAKGGDVVHVPLVIGAVVPMYNLPGLDKRLIFDGPSLAAIFTGSIKQWNDPKLQALNPGVNLPTMQIQPVYRSDASGTTFIFVDYLAKVSPEFKSTVGVSNDPNWPKEVGTRQNKSDGVAGHITRTPGAIGYVELTYALDTKSQYGSVVNKAGKTVTADLDSITAAATATLDRKQTDTPFSLHALTYSLTNADGETSYPIAGMSYAVVYAKLPAATGKPTVAFLKWSTSDEGQILAKKRNFAPLPEALRQQISQALDKVQYE